MITSMELLKKRIAIEGKLNISDIIKSILKDAGDDVKRQYMSIGQDYYENRHDILKEDFTKKWIYDEDEKGNEQKVLVTNENKSNYKTLHNFHRLLIDQKASFIAGKTPSVTVKGSSDNSELKEFEDKITKYVDERFADTQIDWLVGASNKGVEFLHLYIDPKGMLKYTIIPAQEVIAFYDAQYQEIIEALIRFYSISIVQSGGKNTERKRVEWWTAEDVTYYVEDDNGNFVLDSSVEYNPAPHFWNIHYLNSIQVERQPHSWGKVPFVELRNNSTSSSDLEMIKGLQDAYNLISSTSTNNQIDLVELYWMIQGYGGETAKAINSKLQINKAVSITDPNGKISAQQVTLSVEERLSWLKMLRRDIYHIGMGMDVDDESFGTAPSGVSLDFKYELLEQKANKLIRKYMTAQSEFWWFVTQFINQSEKKQYDSSLVKCTVNKSKHTNELDTIRGIMESRGLVPDKILLEKHPYVDDVNEALKELDAQKANEIQRMQSTFGSPPNTHPGDDED